MPLLYIMYCSYYENLRKALLIKSLGSILRNRYKYISKITKSLNMQFGLTVELITLTLLLL